jgi:hypothetical protein
MWMALGRCSSAGVENSDKFILLIEWADMEAHTAFTKLPAFAEFRALLTLQPRTSWSATGIRPLEPSVAGKQRQRFIRQGHLTALRSKAISTPNRLGVSAAGCGEELRCVLSLNSMRTAVPRPALA